MKNLRLYVLSLMMAFALSLPAAAVIDNTLCSAADIVGFSCDSTRIKNSGTEEFNALSKRASIYLNSVSGTNTITATAAQTGVSAAITGYTNGQPFKLKPAVTNTGAVTLNVDGVGAIAVVSSSGSALGSGDLQSSGIYDIVYYSAGPQFRVTSLIGTGTAAASNQYVTMALAGGLSDERVLTAGNCTTVTDGGANSTATVAVASCSSANLATAMTDETGSGANVFANTPTLVTPVLGAATATTINKVTVTAPASAATLTIPDGVTLTGPAASGTAMTLGNTETVTGVKTFGSAGAVGRLKVAGTTSGSTVLDATAIASGTLTLPAATDTLVGKATTDTLTNKTYDTAGTGNSFSINGLAATANTGTGAVVRATTPTLVTPVLGVATATSINGATITSGTLNGSVTGTNTGDQTITLTGDVTGSGTGSFAATVAANSVALTTDTTGNYMVDLAAGAGIAITHTPGEGSTGTVAFSYADAGADPALGADACQFTSNATTSGFIVCEGDTANTFETRLTVTDPTADRVFTIPDAASNAVQPLTCGGSDKVSAISALGVVTCTADSGASGGDSITVNGAATTDPDFDDATPAAVSGANVKWQYSAGDLSGYLAAASTTVIGPVELATSAESEAGTDTVRANTPAGLLAAISGQKTISIPGGALVPATTAGCTAATLESATNKIVQKICGFTSTTVDQFGWFQFAAPKSWDEGTITAQFFWTSASGTGDVVWSLACLARSDDDAVDTALGTAVTVTDTQLTAGDLMISPATSAVTVGGTPAEGDEIFCRAARVGTNGSDTHSGTAQLSAVKVLYSINNFTDD